MLAHKIFKCQICGKQCIYDKNYKDDVCYFCKFKSKDYQVEKASRKLNNNKC